MKIIEFTYQDGTHSYSTSSQSTAHIMGTLVVSETEYEVEDSLGQEFLDNPAGYVFSEGGISAKP